MRWDRVRPRRGNNAATIRRGAFGIHKRHLGGFEEFVLSHAPTGLRIYSFATSDDAAECAKRLEPLTDWSAISEKFESGSDLFSRVKPIVEEIHERDRH